MAVKLADRCRAVELLLTDVDGVLTDGSLFYDDRGVEIKRFNIRDGQGVRLWREVGLKCGVVTSRQSPAVERRVAELGIDLLRQGVPHKLTALNELCRELHLRTEQVAYVGDDLLDLGAMRAVGLGVAVADAVEEVRAAAHYVTSVHGGHGALRETIELVLKNSGRWEAALRPYLA